MIQTRAMPPHLAQAVKRETSGLDVQWTSLTGMENATKAVPLIWALAVPATVYMLFESWDRFSTLCAVDINEPRGLLAYAPAIDDLVTTLLWLGAAIASLFVPAYAQRTFGEHAHVLTDTTLMQIIATKSGSTTVHICPLNSVIAVEQSYTNGDTGNITVVFGLRRASDGDVFRKSFNMSHVRNPTEVEQLLNRLALQAGAAL
jgi:hypothetical protein